ncbi:hypothetical protein REPUB_Repub13aG0126900 [Reevesia pubescens]
MFLGLCQSMTIANGFNQSTKADNIRCIEKERHALLTVKQSLIDNSGRLSSWGSEAGKKDCCLWRGVRCSNRTGHVIMLDLGNHVINDFYDDFGPYESNRLRGKINPALLELQHLRYLDLGGNDFGGTLFPDINGSLRNLRYLDLHETGLSSIKLNQVGNLSKLQFLDISFNGYSISNLDWFHSLSSLRYLNLSLNFLSEAKEWPQLLTNLPHLEELQLTSCNLPIILSPPSITNSTSSPTLINLSSNNLTSSIYPLLFNVTSKIVDLNLEENLLEGSIPDFFRNMVSLQHLHLSDNQLGGEIPEFLGNICTLKTLHLSDNHFSGFVPADLSGCIQNSLEILGLGGNRFNNSSILSYVTRFSSLRELALPENGLNGSFPTSFKQPSKLTSLYLYDNQLTGSLPDFTKFSSLKVLDINHNRFNGTVSEFRLGSLSELEYLDASWNSLGGLISEAHFKNLSKLHVLDLSFNLLAFNLQTQRNLLRLDISGAGISDNIPDWFWDLPDLNLLNVSLNQIPGMLSSVKFLGFTGIDLSSNLFEGPLPVFPITLNSLILAKNRFSGSISPLCTIAAGFLNILDLSDNLLHGVLPDCFFHWQDLKVLNLANNNFSGGIPTTAGSLLSLETINLHNNSFSGNFPSSLKNCSQLKFLDLSENKFSGRNNLIGSIPENIGQLKQLQSLDLSKNELSGQIPASMADLNFLSYLNLSYNNLSGKIPSGTQLLTMDPSAFVGNQALCGPPIAEQCPRNDTRQDQPHDGHTEDRDEFSKWLYVGMGTGFFIAFWGVFGTLLLKTSWRHAYFRLLDSWKDSLYVTFILWGKRLQRKFKS